jgi:muconate cycloisomerase
MEARADQHADNARVDEARMDLGTHKPLIIRRVDAIPVGLPLKKAVAMAGSTVDRALNILVRIEAMDGTVGWGEAASAPTMTGDTLGGLVSAVRDHLAPQLVGQDAWMRPALRGKLQIALYGNTGAHSAIELALLDLAGQASGLPLVDLIGGAMRRAVAPMWLLGNASPEQDVAEAHAKHAQGFGFFKLKIGTKPVETEIAGTLALRRALGTAMPLCADANGGLSFATARHFVEGVRDAGLMFVEQPLAHHDLGSLAKLTRLAPMPIGADEGIHSLDDIGAHERCGAGGVSLKLIKLGGMSAALEAARLCERLGLAVNIAAKIAESSIASAAAIHLACAVSAVDWGVSLTHFYLAEDVAENALAIEHGMVALPSGPGLGITVDEAAVERFRVAGS